MQITIVQSEIETAIRNYIGEQINVKEGMQIDIVLKATRGDEGQTAIIDIHPVAVAATAAVNATKNTAGSTGVQNTQTQAVAKTAPKLQTAPAVQDVAGTAQTGAGEAGNTTQDSATGNTATDAATDNAGVGEGTGTMTGTVAEGTAPAAPARSLFAGLKKTPEAAAA